MMWLTFSVMPAWICASCHEASEAAIESPSLLAIIIGAASFYLMVPAGIPFLTPANSLIDVFRSIHFTIGVLVAIYLYLNEFTLLESVFVGIFWTAYMAHLIMV